LSYFVFNASGKLERTNLGPRCSCALGFCIVLEHKDPYDLPYILHKKLWKKKKKKKKKKKGKKNKKKNLKKITQKKKKKEG
jgi:hypothetical protein